MLTRLIIFLVRMKLGLLPYQTFRFANQKSKLDYYYFEPKRLVKVEYHHQDPFYPNGRSYKSSNVSLNWLLNERCNIVLIGKKVYR